MRISHILSCLKLGQFKLQSIWETEKCSDILLCRITTNEGDSKVIEILRRCRCRAFLPSSPKWCKLQVKAGSNQTYTCCNICCKAWGLWLKESKVLCKDMTQWPQHCKFCIAFLFTVTAPESKSSPYADIVFLFIGTRLAWRSLSCYWQVPHAACALVDTTAAFI